MAPTTGAPALLAGLLMLFAHAARAALSPDGALFLHHPAEREAPGAPPHAPRLLCAPGPGGAAPGAAAAPWACRNWAGTVEWRPGAVVAPETEAELAGYLQAAAASAAATGAPRLPIKAVGSAHSWAGLFAPAAGAGGAPGVTIAMHRLAGVTRVGGGTVEVLAGTSFAHLYAELAERGLTLAFHPGGITALTVGGAVAVGFHGSQLSTGGVSSVVTALRLLDADGNAHDLSDESDPGAMKAARMALGMCGIITRVTLPVVPEFHVRRRRWRVDDVEGFLREQLPQHKREFDRYHYYVHPASGSAWPMTWEDTTAAASATEGRPCMTALEQEGDAAMTEFGPDGLPLIMRWDNCSDVSVRALTHAVDMEAQPLWNGELYVSVSDAGEADAVLDILRRFREAGGPAGPNPDVWLHARYVRGDEDAFLNPCRGPGACVAFELALVANAMADPLPPAAEWEAYFRAFADVLLPLGGRPHHAKFSLPRPPATPAFGLPVDRFRQQCARFDPQRLMRNEAFDRMYALPGDAPLPAAAGGDAYGAAPAAPSSPGSCAAGQEKPAGCAAAALV